MKVFFSIWILAVLIQEVIPSTLVRLPRQTEKNLSLVHTEYEAKYEQKGKHGNESFSSVSGKQEIVHDNCAENWNSFAEKCASLIKDLVASLANAVSSKPGDATNLQLHIKNTFRHFDNTHNCTCLNHTAKTLSDLNLSPLFKNITINTVGSSKKCGGKGQLCNEDKDSDTNKNKSIVLESNGVGGDEKGFDQKQLKENSQPSDKLFDEYNNKPPTGNVTKSKIFDGELTEEQKQQNRALVDAEDLNMNPENAESSSDQSTNNSRRQIKYPENLMKPQKISKNLDNYPLAGYPKYSSSNQKHPENVRYPILVTARPNPQSAKPFESPVVALNPPSLSGTSLESDFSKSPEYEPSHVLLPQENSSRSTTVSPQSSSIKSNGMPSSASYLLTLPNNENSSPNNNYLRPAPQVVPEPHSSFNNEDDPKEVLPSKKSGLYQKPINPMTNRNNQSPTIISKESFTKDYNPDPTVLVPKKTGNNKSLQKSPVALPENQFIYNQKSEGEKPVTDTQALNPLIIPIEQLESDQKLLPSALPEKPISYSSNSKSSGRPITTLPEPPLLVDSLDPEVAQSIKSVSSKLKTPFPVNLPEESVIDSHVLKSGFIPAEQTESGPGAIPSPIIKSTQQPFIILPEKPKTEGFTSDLLQSVPDNYKSNVNSPAIIPEVPVESTQSVAFPGEFKTTKSESSGLILPESPLFIQNKKPTEEPTKEWLSFTTPKMSDWDKTSSQGNIKPDFKMNLSQEDQNALNRFPSATPVINSNNNFLQSSEPESDVVTLNPSPTYKPEDVLPIAANGKPLIDDLTTIKSPVYKSKSPFTGSSSNPSPGTVGSKENPAILSPEDVLPIAANGKPLIEDPTITIKSPVYKSKSPFTGSSSNPSPGTVGPKENPAILSPEDVLPIAANGKPLIEDPTITIKSPVYKSKSPFTGSSSNPSPGTVGPKENPAILSPEDMLPIADNGKPLIEEPATTESVFDQTTGDGLYQTIPMIKPISSVPEVANQQSGISASIEKQVIDSNLPDHPKLAIPEFFNPQYSDKEKINSPMGPMGKLQYPQQSVQKEIFTTPLPSYPEKIVTTIPATGQQLNPQPEAAVEGSEIYESQGKDFTVTEIPTASNIPGASITKDQRRQPSVVALGDTQNEEQVNTPTVAPKIEATTPVIVYPVKSLPILSQSYQESSQPVLVNSGFPDDNQKSEIQPPIKSLQAKSVTPEQRNSNGDSLIQSKATTESSITHDSPNEQEHPVMYAPDAPVRESDNVQNPQVIAKPDKISTQLIQSNFDDHPQNFIDLNSIPASTSNSETTPVFSSEPHPEIVISSTPLKPAQPGVLVQNTEVEPQQEEEQNPLLIQPTTFQTTSEDPTPSQVNIPGLLTHTTSVPQDSDETIPVRPSTSPKSTSIYEHDDDDEEDCCSCESCTEEEISDPKQYKETACKNLEEARKELKAIFDKIKKKLKCGRKAPQTITSS